MPAARASWVKSESRSVPWRTRWLSTRAVAVSMRCTSASLDISSEKMATPCPSLAAWAAMLRQNAVFPMEGRAATTTSSDGWKPDVSASKSTKPLGTPVIALPLRWSVSMRSIVGHSISLMRVNPSLPRCWEMVKILDSATSSRSVAVEWPS